MGQPLMKELLSEKQSVVIMFNLKEKNDWHNDGTLTLWVPDVIRDCEAERLKAPWEKVTFPFY